MPADTWENVLSQVQRVLDELYNNGRTTLTPDEILTLADRVDQIHRDEHCRNTTLHKSPRVVRWDDEGYFDDTGDEEGPPA